MLAYGRVMNPLNLFLHFPLLSLHSSNPPSLCSDFFPSSFLLWSISPLFLPISQLKSLFSTPHFFGVIPSPTPSPGCAVLDKLKVDHRRPYLLQLETGVLSKQRYRCDASRCRGKCLLQTINTSGSSENYNPLKFRDNGYVRHCKCTSIPSSRVLSLCSSKSALQNGWKYIL